MAISIGTEGKQKQRKFLSFSFSFSYGIDPRFQRFDIPPRFAFAHRHGDAFAKCELASSRFAQRHRDANEQIDERVVRRTLISEISPRR